MANQFSFGLKIGGLKVGDVAADGGAGTVLTSPGKARQDTVKVIPSEPTDTEFYEEGLSSSPAIIITKFGVDGIEFDLMTFDKQVIADFTGGSVTGAGAEAIYAKPLAPVNVEKTVQLTDTQAEDWLYPRVKFNAYLVGNFSSTDINVVRCKGKVMQPTKEGVASFYYGKQPVPAP